MAETTHFPEIRRSNASPNEWVVNLEGGQYLTPDGRVSTAADALPIWFASQEEAEMALARFQLEHGA